MKYDVNEGKLDRAIRMGCNDGFYQFIHDYSKAMGMTASGGLRRLALIGARCENEHGNQTMPSSYDNLDLGMSKPKKKKQTSPWEDD